MKAPTVRSLSARKSTSAHAVAGSEPHSDWPEFRNICIRSVAPKKKLRAHFSPLSPLPSATTASKTAAVNNICLWRKMHQNRQRRKTKVDTPLIGFVQKRFFTTGPRVGSTRTASLAPQSNRTFASACPTTMVTARRKPHGRLRLAWRGAAARARRQRPREQQARQCRQRCPR